MKLRLCPIVPALCAQSASAPDLAAQVISGGGIANCVRCSAAFGVFLHERAQLPVES